MILSFLAAASAAAPAAAPAAASAPAALRVVALLHQHLGLQRRQRRPAHAAVHAPLEVLHRDVNLPGGRASEEHAHPGAERDGADPRARQHKHPFARAHVCGGGERFCDLKAERRGRRERGKTVAASRTPL